MFREEVIIVSSALHERFVDALSWREVESAGESFVKTKAPSSFEVESVDEENH